MKKLLVSLIGLVLVGAGCLPVANKPVDGKWQLAFDLPSGWVMVVPYEVSGTGTAKPVSDGIRRDDSEIYLQSTDRPICYSSGGPCAEGSASEGDQVRVSVLDSHRRLDVTELKDLGRGFYLKAGPTTPADGPELLARDTYYLKTDKATYQFSYMGNAEMVKKIILSAKEVTHFTDIPMIEVKTE